MHRIKVSVMGCVLLTSLSCNAFRQPYTPPIPIDQIPRIEVPFGDTGKTIKDELAGGSKLYVVRVHENEDLQLDLRPQDLPRDHNVSMPSPPGVAPRPLAAEGAADLVQWY